MVQWVLCFVCKGDFFVPITTGNITESWEQEDEGENQFIFLLEERVARVCGWGVGPLGVGTDLPPLPSVSRQGVWRCPR